MRELPENTEHDSQNRQVLIEYTWPQATDHSEQLSGELIVDSHGSVYMPATVRDLPPELLWGWEGIDIRDNNTLPGPGGYPMEIAGKMMCPRSPEQALAWISSAGGTQDESLINRALSAYDWRNGKDSEVENIVDLVIQWPTGVWEQQYHYPEYNSPRPVGRYRYISDTDHVYVWVRAVKVLGCWAVSLSPPQDPVEPETEGGRDWNEYDLPEQTQQDGNLYILWEADPNSTQD